LFEALDSMRGEARHTIFADTVNPEAALFGFHFDLKVPEPLFVFAELFGADRSPTLSRDHSSAAKFSG
jgi:hypothetical protein